jgi:hypothetical protein
MRERSGRQDVPERKRPAGLARLASAANRHHLERREAEPHGQTGKGDGPRRGVYGALVGRLTAELPRHAVSKEEGYDLGGRKDFGVMGEREAGRLSGDWGSVWVVVWIRASR